MLRPAKPRRRYLVLLVPCRNRPAFRPAHVSSTWDVCSSSSIADTRLRLQNNSSVGLSGRRRLGLRKCGRCTL